MLSVEEEEVGGEQAEGEDGSGVEGEGVHHQTREDSGGGVELSDNKNMEGGLAAGSEVVGVGDQVVKEEGGVGVEIENEVEREQLAAVKLEENRDVEVEAEEEVVGGDTEAKCAEEGVKEAGGEERGGERGEGDVVQVAKVTQVSGRDMNSRKREEKDNGPRLENARAL